MRELQRICYRGTLAAVVLAGQAIIEDRFDADDRRDVEAMCLYALEIQAGERRGPYDDADALACAHHARATRHG